MLALHHRSLGNPTLPVTPHAAWPAPEPHPRGLSLIDSIVLRDDRRGMTRLRRHLPPDTYTRAAQALLRASERVVILCGFTIEGRPETDGPPGALALAQGIGRLGGQACIVTDEPTTSTLAKVARAGCLVPPVHAFPIVHGSDGEAHARRLLAELTPTALLCIERCGPDASGRYRTMRGIDITAATAPLDTLVTLAPPTCLTLGIGDGGNELGMGSVSAHCLKERVTEHPCITRTEHLLLAAVSNWGAWGLLAALSLEAGLSLLPSEEETLVLHENLVLAGCIDGVTGRAEPTVDGFSLEQNLQRLRDLHDLRPPLPVRAAPPS